MKIGLYHLGILENLLSEAVKRLRQLIVQKLAEECRLRVAAHCLANGPIEVFRVDFANRCTKIALFVAALKSFARCCMVWTPSGMARLQQLVP